MATLRGERFEIDLDDDGIAPRMQDVNSGSNFIGDVLERETTTVKPPTFKSGVTGFPAHKVRTGQSRFKQNRNGRAPDEDVRPSRNVPRPQPLGTSLLSRGPDEADEKWRIDQENRRTIAEMSPAEIEAERQELFSGLSPALLEKLLKRANIDDEPSRPSKLERKPQVVQERPSKVKRKVSFALPETAPEEERRGATAKRHSISDSPKIPPEISQTPLTTDLELPPQSLPDPASINDGGSVHFPTAPAPELDPNSESFLEDLHTKYFPNLAHDPSKLSWMSKATEDEDASYAPSQEDLVPADLRFDFKGALIPPSLSNTLPTDLGLHHHGLAPSAAGYTIPELALLARSTYPAQRCIAFQTLGRILYRLGIGEFGDESNLGVQGVAGEKAILARGLWNAVEEGKVVDLMTGESKRERGHMTSIAMAQEAVWNWRRGGGRKRKAV
ncbi:hypothetical protein FKW77_000576 [Venturia effusa]|uniref:Transcription factor Rba50 n=1 Tax=Venturia effusa TaxID=50376 RepID=A0A517LQG4_9PEZI|nr:hypothetical protein FKW77_000576 [Venturia effusa]